MIFILDAYNVIHKTRFSDFLDKNLRSAREALAEACSLFACARGDIAQIVLVFDGKSEFDGLPQMKRPKIRTVFSETGQDADDKIVEVLERMPDRALAWVVSDDNFVRNHARAYKANVVSVEAFERQRQGKAAKKKPRGEAGSFTLSEETAREITEAYKKELGLS
ncbi:MAG TPA: NYN domain-containing protein [Verrucomicrobiae bacterium]|jgi:predicted RNA-binding protein with PIN domain|nr:NYN domain-containing protein [Verrucomicrobiae bacterium]